MATTAASSKRRKATPLQAFQDNMADARHLVHRVECFTNRRTRRMRAELRQRVGDALRIPKSRWPELDCLESEDVFVTFKPGSKLTRTDFTDHAPLLRQALVAGCAAFETYMFDFVMNRIGPLLTSGDLSTRAREIPLDLGTWMDIHHAYTHKKRGLRKNVIEPFVAERASTADNRVGELLGLIGVEGWANKVDKLRGVSRGTTVADLKRITKRRNRIAHQGDRDGRGRASISLDYVTRELDALTDIVNAIERVA